MPHSRLVTGIVLMAVALPGAASGQTVCAGHTIRDVRVETAGLFAIEREPFVRFFQTIGNGLSWQTRPATVRRELRVAPGDACDPRRLAESARILRAQPYLRSAEIVTTPAPGGAVDLDVRTRDEWALNGGVRIVTGEPRAIKSVRISEDNLFGLGMLGQVRYDYYARRAGLVVDLLNRQFMGHHDAGLALGRTSVGPVGEVTLRRPFESEFDRVGWRAGLRWRKEPFVVRSSAFGTVTVPLVSAGADFAVARRSGPAGRQTMVGAALSLERRFPDGAVLAANPAADSLAQAAVAGRYDERRRAALTVFWGYRDVRYVSHAGIDAVHTAEDVREGFEFRLIGGRGIGGSGLQQDWFAMVDGYAGVPLGGRSLLFARGRAEGRYLDGDGGGRWEGLLAAADAFSYTALAPRSSLLLTLQGAGGWRMRTPFQLLVASATTVRGYGINALPAGRRIVAQAEQRYFLGTLFGAVDLGSALFMDVGRGWAGDALFGADTGTLVAAGGGVRLGFPGGSRYVTRVDVAAPLRHGHGIEVRFTVRRQFGVTSREADDVERSRLPVSTSDLFHFTRY